jgi:NADPH-dependent 2,4-dienoyl-CoA reductase/sulfur reductase-like enzyme
VIGGGPAGLKFAEIAAKRGHKVSIYEKDEEFGGQVNIAARIPYREEIKDVVRYMAIQMDKLGVDIHLGKEVDSSFLSTLERDVTIIATGSQPARAEIPGADGTNVVSVWDVLLDKVPVGDYVIIFDITRRWPGLGTAEYLANMGKKVDIITPTFYVGENIESSNVILAYQRILDKGVTLVPNTDVKRIEGSKVTVENVYTHREEEIEGVDTVVMSVGNNSNRKLYDALKGINKSEIYSVGDAVAPRLIQQVIFEAEELAREI